MNSGLDRSLFLVCFLGLGALIAWAICRFSRPEPRRGPCCRCPRCRWYVTGPPSWAHELEYLVRNTRFAERPCTTMIMAAVAGLLLWAGKIQAPSDYRDQPGRWPDDAGRDA